MPNITLPDGKKINFEKSISGFEVAEKISRSLSKQALLISVDGELKDLNHSISKDSSIKIFTSKDKEGLETIDMILHIYLLWQFKNYFQGHRLQ